MCIFNPLTNNGKAIRNYIILLFMMLRDAGWRVKTSSLAVRLIRYNVYYSVVICGGVWSTGNNQLLVRWIMAIRLQQYLLYIVSKGETDVDFFLRYVSTDILSKCYNIFAHVLYVISRFVSLYNLTRKKNN